MSVVRRAIAGRIADAASQGRHGEIGLGDVLGNVSAEDLRKFVIRQAEHDNELHNAVFLEFAVGVKNTEDNKYSGIIRKALASVPVSGDDGFPYDETPDIEILDKWLDKARGYVGREQHDEAILICKACIEEYSQWLSGVGREASATFRREYQIVPFDILEDAAGHADRRELFGYCLSELRKKKYAGTRFHDKFQDLFATLALKIDPGAFLAFQDELLAGIGDKGSEEAEAVLRRKIDFHKRLSQSGKALTLLEENIQINSFRLELVEQKIAKRDFGAAKRLVNDFLTGEVRQDHYLYGTCRKLLLDIALKENDTAEVRRLAYDLIKDGFHQKYYEIYRATFASDEWAVEREKLFLRYGDPKRFADSAADLLVAEGDAERLVHYIEKYLSPERLERYHKSFASDYPEKTLEFFRRVIVSYAEQNVGRSHYEYVFLLLKKMARIKDGKKMARDLVAAFRIRYKGRRVMMEILRRL